MTAHEPVDPRLAVLTDRLRTGDTQWLRTSLGQGGLNWLEPHMGARQFSRFRSAIEADDLTAARRSLAESAVTAPVPVLETTDDAGVVGIRTAVLTRERNVLVAGAVVALLLVGGFIAYLLFRNNDDPPDPVLALATSVVDSVAPTSGPADTALIVTSVLPSPNSSVAPVTVAAPTTPPAPAPATVAPGSNTDAIVTLSRSSTFSPFLSLIEAAGLTSEIGARSPSTILAPTESAFSVLPVDVRQALRSPANRDVLARIVRYNVIAQTVKLNQFSTSKLQSVEGSTLDVVVGNGVVRINDATVTGPDVMTTNGVIHAIDRLLVPPGISLSSLVTRPATTAAPTPRPTPATSVPPPTQPPATTGPAPSPPPTIASPTSAPPAPSTSSANPNPNTTTTGPRPTTT